MDIEPILRKLRPGLVILVAGLLAYANSFPGDFIIDDIHLVAENPLVESMDLGVIFTSDYWGPGVNSSGTFRPLTILSFAVNKRLLGPEAWSYHLVNVALHALVGLVFYNLLLCWRVPLPRAFGAAAIFAFHPIHAEVLNVVVGRSELLVALFFLLALRLASTDNVPALLLSAFCYLMALLAKEHALTFPAVLVLSDLFFRREVRKRLPFYGALLALTGAWIMYREFCLVYGPDDPFRNSEQINAIYQPLAQMSAPVRILTALRIQLLYLGKLLCPVGLQAVYSGPAVATPVASLFSGWGGMIVLAGTGFCWLAFQGWRSRKFWGVAIPLYFIVFSVASNIFFVSGVAMAERLAYLPSAWFCLGLAGCLGEYDFRFSGRDVTLPVMAFSLLMLASLTWSRNLDFSNPVRLWGKDFQRDSRNTVAGTYLIDAYVQESEYAKAAEVGRMVLANHPDLTESLEMQAWLLVRDKRPHEALEYAGRALAQAGNRPSPGLLTTLVEANLLLGRPAEVLRWLDLQDESARVGFYWELKGDAYAALGMERQAVDAYRRIDDVPSGSLALHKLEKLLIRLGEVGEAARVREVIRGRGR